MHFHKSNVHVIYITELYCLVWYLMLALNLEAQMMLGHIGLVTVGRKALRLGKGILTKVQPMARLHHVNLFVQMRVNKHRTKGII